MGETLRIGGDEVAEVKVMGVQGETALGFHRLVFPIEFAFHSSSGEPRLKIVDLGARLMVKGRGQGNSYIGRLYPRNLPLSIDIWPSSRPRTEYLEIELDRGRLEALEDLRSGNGLVFTLSIWGCAMADARLGDFTIQVTHEVNQGTWAETLRALGFARKLLIEVPAPGDETPVEFEEAVSHLMQAQGALYEGRYRDTIGACREVLEALNQALDDNDFVEEAGALFEGVRSWDKANRLRVVRRSLRILCHPARHADEVASEIEWNRTGAIAVLTMVSALVQRLGETNYS